LHESLIRARVARFAIGQVAKFNRALPHLTTEQVSVRIRFVGALTSSGALHDAFGGKYIANNGYDRQTALDAVASGHAHMVAFGRHYIGNPDLVERLRLNAPLTESDKATYYGGGAEGYIDYEALEAVGGR